MISDEIDIALTKEEEEKKIEFLESRKFENFRIHPYFDRGSYFKHAVEIETVKEIYPQFNKIIAVFKRPAKKGYKYSFRYQLEETKSLILCFYLDENPPVFFNAYFDYTRQKKKLQKKIQKWMNKEFNKQK